MAVNLSPVGGVAAQFFTNSGAVLTGGKIYTYAAGTSTPQATYTTSAGNVAWTNPIVLDAAGRVPSGGEIWLTDGLTYKFLLKDSNDVLIATYDNISGINSNFVNYTNEQEIQTATAGQTVFTLTTMQYQPGTGSLSVFVDGVNQYGPGAQYAYVETNDTTVTFNNGLHVGASVKFTTSALNSSSGATAAQTAFTGFKGQVGNVQDLAGSDGLDWIGFQQSGTGAVAYSAQDKQRQTVSVFDFMTSAQIADVQSGAASIDCLNAFEAAKESFPNTFDTTFYKQGGTILVPPGRYYLSDTFKIDRNIVLRGAGAPYGNALSISQLVFADNRDGILVVDYRDSPSNKQGSGLVIEGLYLTRKNTGGTLGSGISLKTTARIYNVTVSGFREHGIKIDASTSYSPASNANLWEIHSCTLDTNGGNGLYVKGADANAGAAYNVNAIYNGGWGIYDSSFLGNTYVACHTATNTLGSYKSDNLNARNCFVGCYSEGGQPAASIVAPSMIIGGLHAAGYGSTDPALDSGGSTYGGLLSNASFATGVMNIGAGQSLTAGNGLNYADTGGTYSWTFSKAVGRWGYKWANLSTPGFLMWYDRTATPGNGYARDLSAENGALGIGEHYFGSSSQMKFRGLGSAAPTTGTYLQGDIVWNDAPTSGGNIGWVCTAGGSPGTWKTFGVIS